MGKAYNSLGQSQEALEFHLKALKIMSKAYDEHPNIAQIYNNMGLAYEALGKAQERGIL